MRAYKVALVVIDHDDIGPKECKLLFEGIKYPNHCMNPDVQSVDAFEIGEWTDEHPMNRIGMDSLAWLDEHGTPLTPDQVEADRRKLQEERGRRRAAATEARERKDYERLHARFGAGEP